jgi:glycosyltransferase involved in cell wall biosynthesis
MISIIIPTYNEEKAVEKTIRQFSALTIPHEVIISDSQSTDQTVAIAKPLADNVVLLPPDKERSASCGRNNGAAAASGEFLVFMDCDTFIPDPDAFFAAALDEFKKDPKLVGISARIEVDEPVRTLNDAAVSALMNAWFALLNNVFRVGMASGKFQMVRAATFKKTGGFDERLFTAEDVDFFGRLARFGRTKIVWQLAVFHPGRRFHQRGAWRTLFLWMMNAVMFWLYKKPSSDWEPVR